jgi:hypothetical protein
MKENKELKMQKAATQAETSWMITSFVERTQFELLMVLIISTNKL